MDYTLSEQRLEKVKFSPIQVDEFISALAKTQYMFKNDFEDNKVILNFYFFRHFCMRLQV